MLTANTITDEQIYELRNLASGNTPNIADRETFDLAEIALGWADVEPCLNTHPSHDCAAIQRKGARARCAEILNARAKESK